MLNNTSNQYECLNCRGTFLKATVDKFNQQVAIEKNVLNELAGKETKAWFGNQYYDPKRKKWRNGKKPKKIRLGHNNWLWAVLAFILISIVTTLILNYLFPDSRFAIFIW
jgi:hypothetical protein